LTTTATASTSGDQRQHAEPVEQVGVAVDPVGADQAADRQRQRDAAGDHGAEVQRQPGRRQRRSGGLEQLDGQRAEQRGQQRRRDRHLEGTPGVEAEDEAEVRGGRDRRGCREIDERRHQVGIEAGGAGEQRIDPAGNRQEQNSAGRSSRDASGSTNATAMPATSTQGACRPIHARAPVIGPLRPIRDARRRRGGRARAHPLA
jgi:hypothetical protein